MNRRAGHRRHVTAFSLVEIALVLAVVSFCLVFLVALLSTGISIDHESQQLTFASSIALEVVADLRATPTFSQDGGAATATSPHFGLVIPGPGGQADTNPQTLFLGMDGSFSTTAGPSSTVRVCVACQPPPAGERTGTMVRILVTWPALADPATAKWPSHALGSFETFTALNRN